ncbi:MULTISPECIES: EcsC family protein [unclassified Paracoccus (in: a-proteobacteria)]|uniref:EcsC family protein n=1 Tax=unclassified Paracoccus (in: a-proteobacteria) TaxID=2688777 RepID=UPI0012B2B56B|nr:MULTISPECIES: EcsC family protein [unclassified Paracoccus (in: a-proteobacteria)]UXU74744.1 EcsC family protein [Paracoccus sp. SMMA_5]UXU80641.1 EcsC family protein [Paracoccus sp. SMMA_5_TC]
MTEHSQIPPRQTVLPPITDPTVHVQIDRLARRYLDAGGFAMEILTAVGGKAEGLIERLPDPVRKRMDRITLAALNRAFDAAGRSRGVLRERGDMFNRLLSTTTGAVGGLGGLGGAMIELPVTVTLLLRAIMDIASEHGFDPESDQTRREALHVFAAAGPLADDEGTDLGLLAARMTITGQTLQALIARVAPRLSASLAQKLAAQTVPIFGALAGATINYNFSRYYQELARVHFGLLRLARETGIPREALAEAMEARMIQLRPNTAARKLMRRR